MTASAPDTTKPASWWDDLRAQLRDSAGITANVRRTFGLVLATDRRLLGALVACHLTDAGVNISIAWVGKRIIDAVVFASAHPGDPVARTRAWTWVVVELALVLLRALVMQTRRYADTRMRAKLGLHINGVILEKAASVSYGHFEDPEFMNRLTQARREASQRPLDLTVQFLVLFRQVVTLAGYGALLWSLGPWSVALLLAASTPSFLSEAWFGRQWYRMQRDRTTRNRQLFYLEAVLTGEATVKEVKLLSMARWLIDRYRAIHLGYQREESSLAKRDARATFLWGALSSLAFYAAYAFIVGRTASGAISLGAMTLYLVVFRQGQASLHEALGAVARIHEDNLYMSNLFEYLAAPDDDPEAAITATPGERSPEVVFERVSFRYPGAARDVLTDVSFTLRAGETVALVGRNGAGKTTLVKLLVGLYRPTAGRILMDGVDTAAISASELRQKVGVIFQDFARFQFSAADNVGLGWLPAREDRAAIERAVDDANAREVVERLPRGLDTPLGRAFGGDDLSVGQWQRVALARAFMRRSRLLVLDEPTASMDAEAEHEVFQRLRDLKSGRTAMLITHRFSTVRMADRIVVLETGRLVEEGTHAELLAAGGRYATMFELQAQGYRESP